MFTKSLSLALLAAVAVSGARVRRDEGYGAPEPDTYGAPAESYGAPVESYGVSAPSYGAAETGLDLTTIIIPLLALLGLFLLFPTYVTLTNVRRKREALDTETEVSAVERMMDMYQVNTIHRMLDGNLELGRYCSHCPNVDNPTLQAIIESEECLERVACDVGGLASEAGLDTSLANLGSMMVSNKYSKLMKSFAKAKDCHKIKCGNLF